MSWHMHIWKAMLANGIRLYPKHTCIDVECEYLAWDVSQRHMPSAKASMHECARVHLERDVSKFQATSSMSCAHRPGYISYGMQALVKRHRPIGGSNNKGLYAVFVACLHWIDDIDLFLRIGRGMFLLDGDFHHGHLELSRRLWLVTGNIRKKFSCIWPGLHKYG